MNKSFKIAILFLLLTNCSLDNKTGIWEDKKKTVNIKKKNKVSLKEKNIEVREFNKDIEITLEKNLNLKDKSNNINEEIKKLGKITKYKFSKIDRFDEFDPELIFHNNELIFFDNNGTLFKLDKKLNLIWKKNNYLKTEKKINPILYISTLSQKIIVADSISKLYALNSMDGELLWSIYSKSAFITQPRVYDNKVFVLDSKNKLTCYSIIDGKLIWSINTANSFINSDNKATILIKNNTLFFNNSLGDIMAVDVDAGILKWQISTQNSLLFENIIKFKNSTLVATDSSIIFSNNKNLFYSLDQKSGQFNWKQEINSITKPFVIENVIITISNEGYLFYINHKTGDIIKIINIYKQLSNKLKKDIDLIGFTMTYKHIYLSLSNGRLIIYNIQKNQIESIFKIDNKKISKPFIFDKNVFIATDNSVIRFN